LDAWVRDILQQTRTYRGSTFISFSFLLSWSSSATFQSALMLVLNTNMSCTYADVMMEF
jgi:hypothetical protein